MNRLILILIGIAAMLLSACATAPASTKLTPAQVAARVCPDLQLLDQTFRDNPGLLSAEDQADLDKARPVVERVCSAAAQPASDDLKQLGNLAIPVLLNVVQTSPLPPDQKLAISLGINLAKTLVAQHLAEKASDASGAK